VEYWFVATCPKENNGLGMQASGTWETLVSKHQILGKQAHDANLVAVMLVYGVRELLTFNGADFKREFLEVI
jgi:predicted nucleic acid-binding protein